METVLALFASFVMDTETVMQIVRWDMAVLRESPWYREIWQEAHERGLEQGLAQGERLALLRILQRRFDLTLADLDDRLATLPLTALETLMDTALDVTEWTVFAQRLAEVEAACQRDGRSRAQM